MLRSFGEALRPDVDTTPATAAHGSGAARHVQPAFRFSGRAAAMFMREPESPRRC